MLQQETGNTEPVENLQILETTETPESSKAAKMTLRSSILLYDVEQHFRQLHASKSAVRSTLNAQAARRRDLARDQILRHGDEVVVHHLPMRLQPRVVPRRPNSPPPRMLASTYTPP